VQLGAGVSLFDPRLAPRFWSKVIPEPNTGCWLWLGADNGRGYGRVCIDGRTMYAHRVTFERLRGPIPDGMQLDHLCRMRGCCNPAHLQPVTNAENTKRGSRPTQLAEENRRRGAAQTHCIRGHAFDDANTLAKSKNGRRQCRACAAMHARRYRKLRA
jgi:hypothetical protein